MAVITNVDRDHLDTYQDIDDILKAFQTFIQQATPNGQLVLNDDDEPSKRLQVPSNLKKTSFSLQRVSGVTPTTDRPGIRFTAPGLGEVRLNVPGRHMVANALAAMTAAQALGVEPEAIRRGLEAYTGAWRRFEHLGDLHGAPVISDYAHHPTEVLATIRAAREAFPDKRLLVLFQPHQKRRLRQLEDEFSKALADVSYLLLTEVYEVSGREDRSGDAISSRHLAGLLRGPGKTILFLPTVQEALDVVAGVLTPGDVLLCLGAGDIHATLTAFLKEAR
jgi:UDP-N-acetylmuramate--alanine ligase